MEAHAQALKVGATVIADNTHVCVLPRLPDLDVNA
jgi:hypothetical protein